MNPRHQPGGPSDLDEFYRAATPPEPSEAEWAGVWAGIVQGLARRSVEGGDLRSAVSAGSGDPRRALEGDPRRALHPRRALLPRRALAAAAVAAGLLLGLSFGLWRPGLNRAAAVEPFPVASDEDVEIVSVDAEGATALLVGGLPLRHPIVLMQPGDVSLKSVERDREGEFPDVRLQADNDASPMILGPVAAGLAGEPQ